MIVKYSLDFISIQNAAYKISSSAHAAYWLEHLGGAGESSFLIQEREIIEGFRDIAVALGYQPVPVVGGVSAQSGE